MIYDFNKEHGFPTDGFIFVNENGNAHRHGIDYRLFATAEVQVFWAIAKR